MIERVQVGGEGREGTKIKPEEDLGLDTVLFLSPEINTQLNWTIFGHLARIHLSYSDITLHGLYQLKRDIGFGRTVFPAGNVLGTQFTHRRARLRYFQEVYKSDLGSLDFQVGGDYLFFRNILHTPGFARQKDVTEAGIPALGARAFLAPFSWGQVYARMGGFYWNLGREAGASGIFEWGLGLSVFFSKSWGFMMDFSFLWISLRKGREDRVVLDYWEYGPGIAIYACL
jgi:hypothetical protein